jgi:hypothetical protein
MSDSDRLSTLDLDKALLNPGSVFSSPQALLQHRELSKEQKIEILRRWAYDASEDEVALEEGMPDGESDLLRTILVALDQLAGGIDMEQTGPSKQHGIPRSAVRNK